MVAHIWPELKSRYSLPSTSVMVAPSARAITGSVKSLAKLRTKTCRASARSASLLLSVISSLRDDPRPAAVRILPSCAEHGRDLPPAVDPAQLDLSARHETEEARARDYSANISWSR